MNPAIAVTVGAHVLGGVLLVCLFLPAARLIRNQFEFPRSRRSFQTRALWTLTTLFGISTISGLSLLFVALSGRSVSHSRELFAAHILGGLALALPAVWLGFSRRLNRPGVRRLKPSSAAVLFLLMISGCSLAVSNYAADGYFTNLTAATAEQAGSPYFPAGSQIERPGDWTAANASVSCGQTGCHPAIVDQWRQSSHAWSHNGATYRTALAAAGLKLGSGGVKWCAGCHAPLSLPSDSSNPGEAPTEANERVSVSVDCLSCHAMSHVADTSGNGRARYSPPAIYPFAGSKSAGEQWLNGFLVRLRPTPHKAGLSGPRGSAGSVSCAPCHRLSVGPLQNQYKFMRFDNTWGDWQASSYSGESAHTFTAQPFSKGCVDCHMPTEAGASGPIHNHAGISKLPSVRSRLVSGLGTEPMHVEIFAMRRGEDKNGRELLDAPLASSQVVVTSGQTVTLDVLVENRGIGHAFPGGMPVMPRAWLDISVADRSGHPVSVATGLTAQAATHHYGLLALDRNGKPVSQDDFYAMVAPISNRTIPAGEGEVARFRLKVPVRTNGELRITAKLHSRMEEARAGKADQSIAEETAQSEVIAEHSVTLKVIDQGAASSRVPLATPDPTSAPRFYAYGVALLRPDAEPEQLSQARSAFQQALRLRPRNPEYMIALGRTFLADGDLLSARAQFELALKSDARSPGARAWLGNALLRMGQFEKALTILNALLQEYPRDRLLLLDIGLCYLKNAQFDQASVAFNRSLEVDPDDASAHYNLMRCYTAMNRLTDARREEAIFRALQDDEPLSTIVEPYLQKHPEVRRESLRMHVHDLSSAK